MGWTRDLESVPRNQDQEIKMATPKCRHFQPRGFWNYPACFVTCKSTEYLFCGKPLRLMGRTRDLEPVPRNQDQEIKMATPKCRHFQPRGFWNYPACFVTCKSTEYLYFGKPPGLMGWKRDPEPPASTTTTWRRRARREMNKTGRSPCRS